MLAIQEEGRRREHKNTRLGEVYPRQSCSPKTLVRVFCRGPTPAVVLDQSTAGEST